MRILGIETSCDETAAAVVETRRGASLPIVLSNIISSQIEIHKKYGGVVPEVAAREHVLNILPVINEALEKAGAYPFQSLPFARGGKLVSPSLRRRGLGEVKKFDAIAVTTGPGLITSLQVGVETAKVLSYVWNIPVISVNHIEGHIYANFVGKVKSSANTADRRQSKVKSNIIFTALILTVSGGHTMLILMKGHGKHKVIGETLDDAAGEAFDKAAAMLGIGYPGGPAIAKQASQWKSQIPNPKSQIILPRPMINSRDYNFSFSGLKTALLYKIKKDSNWKKYIPEYAHEFQQAVIDVLIHKTIKAANNYKVKTIMLSGGVAANIELRKQMAEKIKKLLPTSYFLLPDLKYTTDNAAMIATAGYFKAIRKKFTPWQKLKADCNLEF